MKKLLLVACLTAMPVWALQLGSTGGASGLNVSNASGILPSSKGGTGINNAGTLTNASNSTITGGGTLALGGFTLTVPQTDTAAVLGRNQIFTQPQTIQASSATPLTVTGTALANINSIFNVTNGGNQSGIIFQDGGVTKWQVAKHADNTFIIYDSAQARIDFQISTTGNSTITGTTTVTQIQPDSIARQAASANSGDIGSINASFGNVFSNTFVSQDRNAATFKSSNVAIAGTTVAGTNANLLASSAVAGNITAGAAAGGSVVITGGNAARLTSGNANGGDVSITGGTGIGTGTPGNVVVNSPLRVPTGAAGIAGTATLVAGVATVSTTAVTASSIIVVSTNTIGGTQGTLKAQTSDIVAGTSFIIRSSTTSDTSTVNWHLVN